jgi:copper oxidase (laccase) domain-containing protein
VTLPELREAPTARGDFPCFELREWASEFDLIAGVTARGADFGLASPEPTAAVLDRWRRLRAGLRPGFGGVAVGQQCHRATVAVHQTPVGGWRILDDTDGHLTDQTGYLLAVSVADCVPVYLAAPGSPWFGLLHAGWRGVAGGIVEEGVAKLAALAGLPASGIVIHCGISICGDCYEVGPEVFVGVNGRPAEGKRRLDLKEAVGRRARRGGVVRVTNSPWCTAHDRDRFYSHRASAGADGRMLAYLGRPLS